AVFLDRDGVLIEDTGYPSDPEVISLLPGVGEGLRALATAGWRLVVVSNQSGVARGKFTLARLEAVNERLVALLRAEGVTLDAFYFCPHHAEHGNPPFNIACNHRKPEPGMLRTAADDLDLDLRSCWMIGDRETDIAAGRAAGCRTILLGAPPTNAEKVALDLSEAAHLIMGPHRR
ncbi:MAG: D-glycero-alpha-D-manno-heptose-1,7-bisphosphate 7-phosphatase, partial [Actinomycetota bacterium]